MSIKILLSASLFISCCAFASLAQTERSTCDFSNIKSRKIMRMSHSHLLITKEARPEYPPLAKAAKIQGLITVAVLINDKGNIIETCVSKGHPLLTDAAIKAALQFKYKSNFGRSFKNTKTKQEPAQMYLLSSLTFNFRLD
jgi:hypothetical protein